MLSLGSLRRMAILVTPTGIPLACELRPRGADSTRAGQERVCVVYLDETIVLLGHDKGFFQRQRFRRFWRSISVGGSVDWLSDNEVILGSGEVYLQSFGVASEANVVACNHAVIDHEIL